MPLQRSTSASFSFSAAFSISSGSHQYSVALPAAAGGDVVFRITLRAVFKAKAESRTVRGGRRHLRNTPLAAAAKVFNQGAVGGGFAPVRYWRRPQAGHEDLHRHVVAFALRRPHFRGIQVMRIAGVSRGSDSRFSRRQAQTAAKRSVGKDSPSSVGRRMAIRSTCGASKPVGLAPATFTR